MTKHDHEQEIKGASGGTARQEAVDAINAVWGRCFSDAEKPADTIGHALAVHAELGIAHASALLHVGDQIGRLADELGGFHEGRLRQALAGPRDRTEVHVHDDVDDVAAKIAEKVGDRPAFNRFQDELRKARTGKR